MTIQGILCRALGSCESHLVAWLSEDCRGSQAHPTPNFAVDVGMREAKKAICVSSTGRAATPLAAGSLLSTGHSRRMLQIGM